MNNMGNRVNSGITKDGDLVKLKKYPIKRKSSTLLHRRKQQEEYESLNEVEQSPPPVLPPRPISDDDTLLKSTDSSNRSSSSSSSSSAFSSSCSFPTIAPSKRRMSRCVSSNSDERKDENKVFELSQDNFKDLKDLLECFNKLKDTFTLKMSSLQNYCEYLQFQNNQLHCKLYGDDGLKYRFQKIDAFVKCAETLEKRCENRIGELMTKCDQLFRDNHRLNTILVNKREEELLAMTEPNYMTIQERRRKRRRRSH